MLGGCHNAYQQEKLLSASEIARSISPCASHCLAWEKLAHILLQGIQMLHMVQQKVPHKNKAPEQLYHQQGLLRGRCWCSLPSCIVTAVFIVAVCFIFAGNFMQCRWLAGRSAIFRLGGRQTTTWRGMTPPQTKDQRKQFNPLAELHRMRGQVSKLGTAPGQSFQHSWGISFMFWRVACGME